MSLADRLDSVRRAQQPAVESNAPANPQRAGMERQHRVDPFAEVKAAVHQALIDSLGPMLYDPHLDQKELEGKVRHTLQEVIDSEERPLSLADRTRISQEVADEILGHGPLEPLLRDSEITEIMVNGPNSIYVERAGKIFSVDAQFGSEAHLRRTIDKIVGRIGRRVDEASPMVDARLPDGSRVNAVIPPDRPRRRHADDPEVLRGPVHGPGPHCLRHPHPPGARLPPGAASGAAATSSSPAAPARARRRLLNVLSSYIPEDERIITIEDAAELQLRQAHVLRLESRPSNIEGRGQISIRELVKNSLRMRPDRIVVGEVRDGAALDMLQAMNTGHDGSITTVHANSPRDSLARLETMVLMAGVDLPVRAIREQVSGAIDLVVQQARLKDGSRRVTAISEVIGMEGEVITMQDIFTFDYSAGQDAHGRFLGSLVSTGIRPRFVQDLSNQGVELAADLFVRER